MTPRDRRACTHLDRASDRLGSAYGAMDRGDRTQARAHIDGAIAALMAADEAIDAKVLRMQPREGA